MVGLSRMIWAEGLGKGGARMQRGEKPMADYKIQNTISSKLREKLDFPVIDTDGHVVETEFVLPDFLKQVGGPGLVERYHKATAAAAQSTDQPKRVPGARLPAR